MRCPRCGAELVLVGRSCKKCGVDLSDDDTSDARSELSARDLGAHLMVKWTDGLWYSAEVDDERGPLRHVQFYDGFQMWADPTEFTQARDGPRSRPSEDEGGGLQIGRQVRVLLPDAQPLQGIIDASFGRLWHVSFYGGGQAWLDEDSLGGDIEDPGTFSRALGEQSEIPDRGALVLAQTYAGLWALGIVGDEQAELRRVLFLNGIEAWLEPRQLATLDGPTVTEDSRGNEIEIGQRTLGLWADGRWYPGIIDARFGRLWHVSFDDYDQAWLDASRLVVTTGQDVGSALPSPEPHRGDPNNPILIEHYRRKMVRWRIIAVIAVIVACILASPLCGEVEALDEGEHLSSTER